MARIRTGGHMIRILTCFTLILTNVVVAHAEFNEFRESTVERAAWTATYVGEAEIDQVPVLAALEQAEHEITIPEMMTGDFQSLVPLAPVKKKIYRLTLIAKENPRLKASYTLESKVASVDGQLRKVFLSSEDANFRVLITPEDDGVLRVRYVKQNEQGEFTLSPAVRTL